MPILLDFSQLPGRDPATDEIKSNLKIVFDDVLPEWNYKAAPQRDNN